MMQMPGTRSQKQVPVLQDTPVLEHIAYRSGEPIREAEIEFDGGSVV
jgi:hypothetical protein